MPSSKTDQIRFVFVLSCTANTCIYYLNMVVTDLSETWFTLIDRHDHVIIMAAESQN